MDRRLCLCSASLVLMLISFDGCLARPRMESSNQRVDGAEKGKQMENGREELLEKGNDELRRQRRREVQAQAEAFLEHYGYLSALSKDESHDPADTKRAVRDMQRMYHLDETGELDEKTIRMMRAPRCGVPDVYPTKRNASETKSGSNLENKRIAKRYTFLGTKWKKQYLTWNLWNYPPYLSPEVTKDAIRRAFRLWSDVTRFTFAETEIDKADINLSFYRLDHHDRYPFYGPGAVLAHAWQPERGEVHFDFDEQWTDGTKDGKNLMQVAAHELGHTLGLGHSHYPDALMFPDYLGYKPNFRLSDDDVQGIRALYY